MEVVQISNSQISESARVCMKNTHRSELEYVSCDCNERVLRLQGAVSSFHLKQAAQEAVKHIAGVIQVVNEVTVISKML